MEFGSINGNSSPATFNLTGSNSGVTSATGVPGFGGDYVASALQDIGTTNNTVSVVFTYGGAGGTGGVMAGLRWNDAGEAGSQAFIEAIPPAYLQMVEMYGGGWAYVQFAAYKALALTTGNTYTLTISDDGTAVTASIVDDVGTQSTSFTTSNGTANTEVAFGWVYGVPSYSTNATITAIST